MKPEVLGFEQNAIDTDVISFHFSHLVAETNYHV